MKICPLTAPDTRSRNDSKWVRCRKEQIAWPATRKPTQSPARQICTMEMLQKLYCSLANVERALTVRFGDFCQQDCSESNDTAMVSFCSTVIQNRIHIVLASNLLLYHWRCHYQPLSDRTITYFFPAEFDYN